MTLLDQVQHYEKARDAAPNRVGESLPSWDRTSEEEIQARFYAGDFGFSWKSVDGRLVEILSCGTWNREAGPDFTGVRILIDGEELRGDLEIDPHVLDWERHGHSTNPAYNQVVLHIFLKNSAKRAFTRTESGREILQLQLEIPGSASRKVPTSEARVASSSDDLILDAVRAAAAYRMNQKRAAWLRAESLHGSSEALFQGIAKALGYRNNKIPFLLVAQRSTLKRAMACDGESLLFGLAGFLEARIFDEAEDDTRDYLRVLWETWWKVRDKESRLILSPRSWSFASLRPANHPHRRLAALAQIAKHFRTLEAAILSGNVRSFRAFFDKLEHPYWTHHASLDRERIEDRTALVGRDRVVDMIANIMLPVLSADNAMDLASSLPGPAAPGIVRRAIDWLALKETLFIKSVAGQQGLLQLSQDFYPQPPESWLGLILPASASSSSFSL